MKTTVIHHSADYDGIFCREIAKKFLPNAELIGWDFGDRALDIRHGGGHTVYVLDLPLDKTLGLVFLPPEIGARFNSEGLVWIDHHKSSIDSHPKDIPGYRIDGVAACRLAWQWFTYFSGESERTGRILPIKEDFIKRTVSEPLAVRLAGEYDIWDHRGDGDLEFQCGLDSLTEPNFKLMLCDVPSARPAVEAYVHETVLRGDAARKCYAKRDADIMRSRSFLVDWEGLKFLALNTARCNSNTFAARDVPETGHDALMGFWFDGGKWTVSLYHAAHRKDLDLSQIAVKYGGGGHRGACGFRVEQLPWSAK